MNRRKFGKAFSCAALGLLTGSIGTSMAAASDEVDMNFVHPELRDIAKQLQKTFGAFTLTPESIRQIRAMQMSSRKPVRTDITVTEKLIAVPGGAPDVRVYIINSSAATARPAILH